MCLSQRSLDYQKACKNVVSILRQANDGCHLNVRGNTDLHLLNVTVVICIIGLSVTA